MKISAGSSVALQGVSEESWTSHDQALTQQDRAIQECVVTGSCRVFSQ